MVEAVILGGRDGKGNGFHQLIKVAGRLDLPERISLGVMDTHVIGPIVILSQEAKG